MSHGLSPPPPIPNSSHRTMKRQRAMRAAAALLLALPAVAAVTEGQHPHPHTPKHNTTTPRCSLPCWAPSLARKASSESFGNTNRPSFAGTTHFHPYVSARERLCVRWKWGAFSKHGMARQKTDRHKMCRFEAELKRPMIRLCGASAKLAFEPSVTSTHQ